MSHETPCGDQWCFKPECHEPECPIRDGYTCECGTARKAYQRGREDAAQATGAYVITNLDIKLETADFLDGLWNAASGGEQA